MKLEEVMARATEASAKIAELNKERAFCLSEAVRCEEEQRKFRARAHECKVESEQWDTALKTLKVQSVVTSAEESAKRAQQSAEETLQRLSDKEKQLDEALAKAKEAQNPVESPPAEPAT